MTLEPPLATGSRPLKASCQGHEFSKCQACDHDAVCLLCQQSRRRVCVCICWARLLAAPLYLVKCWLCALWGLSSNMIYLTSAMKRNYNSREDEDDACPARVTLFNLVYFFSFFFFFFFISFFFLTQKHKSTRESLIMNIIYDCHKKFTLLSIPIYLTINQRST